MRDELVIICSPKHRWAMHPYLTTEILKNENEPIIMREDSSGTRDIVELMAKKFAVEPRIAMEFSSTEGIKGAVEANLGIAVPSRNVIRREIRDGTIVTLDIKDIQGYHDFYIVNSKKRKFMSLMVKFYDSMLERQQKSNQAGQSR